MRRFKAPMDAARKLAGLNGDLTRNIVGAIRTFNKAHPEWKCHPRGIGSLSKRISGAMKETFARLFADKEILDWLEAHRDEWDELSRLQGGLRKAITAEMERRDNLDGAGDERYTCESQDGAHNAGGLSADAAPASEGVRRDGVQAWVDRIDYSIKQCNK